MANFGCIDGSRSLNRSCILKIEKILDPFPDPDSKLLKQERSQKI